MRATRNDSKALVGNERYQPCSLVVAAQPFSVVVAVDCCRCFNEFGDGICPIDAYFPPQLYSLSILVRQTTFEFSEECNRSDLRD